MGLFSFLDPIGLFGGGGGGASSSSVTSTVNLNLNGLDKINTTVELKPLELKPLTINSNVDLKPVELKPVTINQNLDLKPIEIKPLTVNANMDLKPVTVSETFDLRPVAVDACQTIRMAPLPDTTVCQPYRHRIAYSLFGVEWGGVTYEGESQQVIESPRRPQVVPHAPPTHRRRPASPVVTAEGEGLRVRVLDADDE